MPRKRRQWCLMHCITCRYGGTYVSKRVPTACHILVLRSSYWISRNGRFQHCVRKDDGIGLENTEKENDVSGTVRNLWRFLILLPLNFASQSKTKRVKVRNRVRCSTEINGDRVISAFSDNGATRAIEIASCIMGVNLGSMLGIIQSLSNAWNGVWNNGESYKHESSSSKLTSQHQYVFIWCDGYPWQNPVNFSLTQRFEKRHYALLPSWDSTIDMG